MPFRTVDEKRRELISKLAISILRGVSSDFLNIPATDPLDVLLMMAIQIGYAQQRPMTPAKAAMYIGIPRVSAMRRLKALEQRGLVEPVGETNYLTMPTRQQQTKEIARLTTSLTELIHQTCRALSKLDTKTVVLVEPTTLPKRTGNLKSGV